MPVTNTRKHWIIAIASILVFFTCLYATRTPDVTAAGGGIQFFKGSWQEALNKSKQENKPIFLDIYATWCGPCKLLKRTTFADKRVAKLYNEKFINVSLDGEIGDGLTLAEKFRIPGYPTLMILNGEGKPLVSNVGFLEAKDFIRFGEDGLAKFK